jgi:hypothetical protein
MVSRGTLNIWPSFFSEHSPKSFTDSTVSISVPLESALLEALLQAARNIEREIATHPRVFAMTPLLVKVHFLKFIGYLF